MPLSRKKGTSHAHPGTVATALRRAVQGKSSSARARRADNAAPRAGGGVTGKKLGPRPERTDDDLAQLKQALRAYCCSDGTKMGQKKAAKTFGISRNDVRRYGDPIKALDADCREAAIEAVAWKKSGAKHLVTTLDPDTEMLIGQTINKFYLAGFPLDDLDASALAAEIAHQQGNKLWNGDTVVCGPSWLKGFKARLAKRGLDLRKLKSSALDPKRAAAATPEVRDSLFDLLLVSSPVFKRMLEKNPDVRAEWTSWAAIPAEYKYNVDEEVRLGVWWGRAPVARAPSPLSPSLPSIPPSRTRAAHRARLDRSTRTRPRRAARCWRTTPTSRAS